MLGIQVTQVSSKETYVCERARTSLKGCLLKMEKAQKEHDVLMAMYREKIAQYETTIANETRKKKKPAHTLLTQSSESESEPEPTPEDLEKARKDKLAREKILSAFKSGVKPVLGVKKPEPEPDTESEESVHYESERESEPKEKENDSWKETMRIEKELEAMRASRSAYSEVSSTLPKPKKSIKVCSVIKTLGAGVQTYPTPIVE
jgi:hypothetical protein